MVKNFQDSTFYRIKTSKCLETVPGAWKKIRLFLWRYRLFQLCDTSPYRLTHSSGKKKTNLNTWKCSNITRKYQEEEKQRGRWYWKVIDDIKAYEKRWHKASGMVNELISESYLRVTLSLLQLHHTPQVQPTHRAKRFRLYALLPFSTTNRYKLGPAVATVLFRQSNPRKILSLPSCSDSNPTTTVLGSITC